MKTSFKSNMHSVISGCYQVANTVSCTIDYLSRKYKHKCLARRKRVVQNPVFVENINLQLISNLVFLFSLNIFGKEKHKISKLFGLNLIIMRHVRLRGFSLELVSGIVPCFLIIIC